MGTSRTMLGRGSDQMVQVVLYNFINLSLTRKEGICIFYYSGQGKEYTEDRNSF